MKTEEELRRQRRRAWIVIAIVLLVAGIPIVTLRFVARRHRVPTGSMRPTIHQHDQVLVNQLAYAFGAKPQAGEVVGFRDKGSKFLYRVVAVPGDRVEMQENVLIVNGSRRSEPYIILDPEIPAVRTFAQVTVPPRSYFVLGDNRDNANDSRFRGFIREDQIFGRMFYVLHVGECDE